MYGVVPAAGEGTRLRPHTATKPKGLVEVADRPLLTHCFETLCAAGVEELVVVVGYRGDAIRRYYGDRFAGRPVRYTQQADQRGLAHALSTTEPAVDGDFLSLNGDNVCRANLGDVVERHRASAADATLLVEDVSVAAARGTGVVAFDDDGAVEKLVEKPDDPPSTSVPRGFFAFSPRIFEACRAIEPSATGEYELTAAIDWLLSNGGRVETVTLDGWCVNVNTAADIERAERLLAEDG